MTENKPTATESGMPISNTCRDITGIGVCKCWRIPDDDGPTEIERYAQQQRERAERAEAECVANHQMYAELSASIAQTTMDRDQYIDCYAGQMKEANAAIAEVARLREGLEKILEGDVDYKSGPTSEYSYYNELSAIKVFADNLLTQTNEASEPTPPPASTEEGADNEERE